MSRPRIDLEQDLSFGFEQTFTVPQWWAEPGFVATSDTPLKRQKMKELAEAIVQVQGGSLRESLDIYNHLQYETFLPDGRPSFVVTMDPGSIEVKTEPARLSELTAMMKPLFTAAEQAGCVTYRNWWYGVRGGTEGGCHVNTGGFTRETNPWRRDPRLLLQYAGFLHNHPSVHYPFMGLDTGPGGNAIRMDEHDEPGRESMLKWREMAARMNEGYSPTAEEFEAFFKGTRIADDRHSAPSFYKYKAPLYLVEDRAQESFRAADEAFLVCQLRLQILRGLQTTPHVEGLRDFGRAELHQSGLMLAHLWEQFTKVARGLDLNPTDYWRFFDRQFPRLLGGVSVPARIRLHEGRRPRVITGQQMRGNLVISKTIDTRFKRFEIHWPEQAGDSCAVNGFRAKGYAWTDPATGERLRGLALDVCVPRGDAHLEISAAGEVARFHLNNMLFVEGTGEVRPAGSELKIDQQGYGDVEKLDSFFTA